MHVLQSLGHLRRDRCRFGLRDRTDEGGAGGDVLLEVTIFQEFHGDVEVLRIIEPAKALDKICLILGSVSHGGIMHEPSTVKLSALFAYLRDVRVGKCGQRFELSS